MQEIIKLKNYSNYLIYPNEGKIWSIKRKKYVGSNKNPKGYWQVHLYSDNGEEWKTKLHRVIWIACYGEIPNGYQVNHIDENKNNNSISNLNLLTPKENVNWGTRNNRAGKSISKALKGRLLNQDTRKKLSESHINNPKRSKKVGAYKNGKLILIFPSMNEAERNGFSCPRICECCKGKSKTHKGYEWKYIEKVA